MKKTAQLWPYSIIGVFVIFIAALASYIGLALSNDVELVADDYYAREIAYGDEMERLARVQALGNTFKLEGPTANQQMILRLPPEHVSQGTTGFIQLYRPNDSTLDQSVPLSPTATGEQIMDLSQLPTGKWKVDVQWQSGEIEYQYRQTLILVDPGSHYDA